MQLVLKILFIISLIGAVLGIPKEMSDSAKSQLYKLGKLLIYIGFYWLFGRLIFLWGWTNLNWVALAIWVVGALLILADEEDRKKSSKSSTSKPNVPSSNAPRSNAPRSNAPRSNAQKPTNQTVNLSKRDPRQSQLQRPTMEYWDDED